MKTKFLFMLCSFWMLFFTLSSFKTEMPSDELSVITQDSQEVDAMYKGNDESGFNFEVDDNGESQTMVFQQIDEPVLSVFDLHSESFIDVNFKVTYTVKIDDDGNEIKTITELEKL